MKRTMTADEEFEVVELPEEGTGYFLRKRSASEREAEAMRGPERNAPREETWTKRVTAKDAAAAPHPAESQIEPAMKFDWGKPGLHLLPYPALRAIAQVMDHGAKKYDDWNWVRGTSWSRYFRAAVSHLLRWFWKRTPDPESGLSHLAHAGACVLILLTFEEEGIGKDNRPGASQPDAGDRTMDEEGTP